MRIFLSCLVWLCFFASLALILEIAARRRIGHVCTDCVNVLPSHRSRFHAGIEAVALDKRTTTR